MSLCNIRWSLKLAIYRYNFASSANTDSVLDTTSGRSLINIIKRIGPSTLPCGTPLMIFIPSEQDPRILTLCFLLAKM